MQRYFKTIKKNLEIVTDISAFSRGQAPGLQDIYVPLKTGIVDGDYAPAAGKERLIEPVDAIKKYRRVVIAGPPGTGKTTLLKHLALESCTGYIPIYIPLREFSAVGKGLRHYINATFHKYGFLWAYAIVKKNLRNDKCILLLDGLDELTSKQTREIAIEEIQQLAETHRSCKIVVTSRAAVYHDELAGFTRLELMELDENRIKEFIGKWFAGDTSGRGKADAVLKTVMNDKDIGTLAKNPLMLSIIAALYQEDRDGPVKRADLFRRVGDVMLEKWDAQKGIGSGFSPDAKKQVLSKLAFRNHSRGRRTMTEGDILLEITRHSRRIGLEESSAEHLLEEISQRSGLLRKLMMDTYDFRYFFFQEYFAALELSAGEEALSGIIPYLSQSWWEDPILFCAGAREDAGSLVEKIRQNFPEDIFYTGLMLAGKCIAEAGGIDPLLKNDIVGELWGLYNTGEYEPLRKKSLAVLARIKPRRIIDELLNRLTGPEVRDQEIAAKLLGVMGNDDVLPSLIMILFRNKERKVRSHAAAALGRIGNTGAVRLLIQTLEKDEDGEVRKSAAEAIGFFVENGGTGVLTALIHALDTDEDERVRGGAVEALGRIKNAEAVSRLIRVLETEPRSSVRWRAALALGNPGHDDARACRTLIQVLHTDRSREVRESAAEALGFIGSTDCIAALRRALVSDKEADVRGSAAHALGFLKSTEALPELIQALITDRNGEVRGRAAYALGRLKRMEAMPYLTVLFNTQKHSLIRGNAAFALGTIGDARAIPFLIQALTLDQDPYVRYRAAEVMGSVGNSLAIPPLKNALRDDGSYYGWKVKDKAYEALEMISRRLHMRISED